VGAVDQGVPALVDPGGQVARWRELVEVVAVCAAACLAVPAGEWLLHERLRVRHAGGESRCRFGSPPDGTGSATDLVWAVLGVAHRFIGAHLSIPYMMSAPHELDQHTGR
jgi:hypothetical protein